MQPNNKILKPGLVVYGVETKRACFYSVGADSGHQKQTVRLGQSRICAEKARQTLKAKFHYAS